VWVKVADRCIADRDDRVVMSWLVVIWIVIVFEVGGFFGVVVKVEAIPIGLILGTEWRGWDWGEGFGMMEIETSFEIIFVGLWFAPFSIKL